MVILVMITGFTVLVGWQFQLDFLKRPLPHSVAMNPLSALLFIFTGFSFFLLNKNVKNKQARRKGSLLAYIIIMAAFLKLSDIIFGTHIQPDQLLFSHKLIDDAVTNIPNHIAPNTAICFLFTGISFLLLHYRSRWKKIQANYFLLPTALLGLFSILGYFFNIPAFYGVQDYIPMAIQTAICFFLISLATVFASPGTTIMSLLTGKLIGSVTLRLLLPLALFIPVLLASFCLYGYRHGYFNAEFGSALLALSIMIVFIILIWYNAGLLNKHDLLRLRVEHKVIQFNKELEEQVRTKTTELLSIFERITGGFMALDNNFCYTYINKRTADQVNRDPLSLTGKNIWTEFPQLKGSSFYDAFNRAMQDQCYTINTDYYPPLDLWLENHIYPSPEGLSVFINDITGRKKAEATFMALKNTIAEQKIQEQKKISRAIIKAQEEEKNRIGLELHDNINQILAGVKIYLNVVADKDDTNKQLLQYPIELIDNTIQEIRSLSQKQVTPLKNINLEELVHDLLRILNEKTNTGFTSCVSNELLSDDMKLNIYRIIQVQVNNIIRHADAKNVNLAIQKKNGMLEIITTDDGKGFDTTQKRKGIGISNMVNRVESYNGNIEILSNPGEGCKIIVRLPIPA